MDINDHVVADERIKLHSYSEEIELAVDIDGNDVVILLSAEDIAARSVFFIRGNHE